MVFALGFVVGGIVGFLLCMVGMIKTYNLHKKE
jgi:hypothetical protein